MGHHFLAIHYKYGQYRFAVISETPSNGPFYVVNYYIKWVTPSWTQYKRTRHYRFAVISEKPSNILCVQEVHIGKVA